MNLNNKRVVIAKTNHIGDVVISLPMVSMIKRQYPKARIIFMANGRACDVAKLQSGVDEVRDWQAILKAKSPVKALKSLKADVFIHASPCKTMAKIVRDADVPHRVGSLYRAYHWLTCNHLANISRNPLLNKRVLDIHYLKALSIDTDVSERELPYLYKLKKKPLKRSLNSLLDKKKFNLVVHPSLITAKSQWPTSAYVSLINSLNSKRFNVILSGTKEDKVKYQQSLLDKCPNAIDAMGQMNLYDYFIFLSYVDGIVAGSTGPLHMGNAQGIYTLGLYDHNKRYIKRWQPIGDKSKILSSKKGIAKITVEAVKKQLQAWAE